MKKILTALFCLALAAPAAQAQNVVTPPAQGTNAAPQKKAVPQQSATQTERHHGTAGMKTNNQRREEKAQDSRLGNSTTEGHTGNAERRATPVR